MHVYTIMVINYIEQSGNQYVHVYSDNTIMAQPPCFLLPLSDSLLLPFHFPLLTWKPSLT
jgi:hypothetical protein